MGGSSGRKMSAILRKWAHGGRGLRSVRLSASPDNFTTADETEKSAALSAAQIRPAVPFHLNVVRELKVLHVLFFVCAPEKSIVSKADRSGE